MPELGTFGSVRGVLGNRYSYRDQVFTGETYLQTKLPIEPSSLTRWRKRASEAGVEELLAEAIEAAKRANVVKNASLKRLIVETTVMEKAIAYLTDSRLLERCRTSGEGSRPAWAETEAELQSRGAAPGEPDWALRAREAIQAG